ncbi:MAG: response regulator [Gemmataceae bacterium]
MPRRNGSSRPGLRVLIVDDYHDGAESLSMLLGYLDYDAKFATDPLAALDMVSDWSPQVALIELHMHKMSGCDFASKLLQRVNQLPMLIALTGFLRTAEREAARAAGFRYVLFKPVELDQLKRILDSV